MNEAKKKAHELVKVNFELLANASNYKRPNIDGGKSFRILEDLSKKIAKNTVNEIIKANPIIPLEFMLESEALDKANEFWNEVLTEIDKL